MSGEHGHAHSHDGPPGGAGWIVLDAIVCATAAALVGLFVEWLYREHRARAARSALAGLDQPAGGPLVERQGEPDTGSS